MNKRRNNLELKAMVEAYKTRTPQERNQKSADHRGSAREKPDPLVNSSAAKLSLEKQPKVAL